MNYFFLGKRGDRNSEAFKKLVFDNASSFCKVFPIAYSQFKQVFEESCVGFLLFTERKNPSPKCDKPRFDFTSVFNWLISSYLYSSNCFSYIYIDLNSENSQMILLEYLLLSILCINLYFKILV